MARNDQMAMVTLQRWVLRQKVCWEGQGGVGKTTTMVRTAQLCYEYFGMRPMVVGKNLHIKEDAFGTEVETVSIDGYLDHLEAFGPYAGQSLDDNPTLYAEMYSKGLLKRTYMFDEMNQLADALSMDATAKLITNQTDSVRHSMSTMLMVAPGNRDRIPKRIREQVSSWAKVENDCWKNTYDSENHPYCMKPGCRHIFTVYFSFAGEAGGMRFIGGNAWKNFDTHTVVAPRADYIKKARKQHA